MNYDLCILMRWSSNSCLTTAQTTPMELYLSFILEVLCYLQRNSLIDCIGELLVVGLLLLPMLWLEAEKIGKWGFMFIIEVFFVYSIWWWCISEFLVVICNIRTPLLFDFILSLERKVWLRWMFFCLLAQEIGKKFDLCMLQNVLLIGQSKLLMKSLLIVWDFSCFFFTSHLVIKCHVVSL